MAQVKLSKAEQRALDIIRYIEGAGEVPFLFFWGSRELASLEVFVGANGADSSDAVPTYHPVDLNTGEVFKTSHRRFRLSDGRYELTRVGTMAFAKLVVKGLVSGEYFHEGRSKHSALSVAVNRVLGNGICAREHFANVISARPDFLETKIGKQVQQIFDLIEEQEHAEAPKKTETPKVLECVTEQWAHVPGIRCRC